MAIGPAAIMGANTRVPFHTLWFRAVANMNWFRSMRAGQTTRRAGWSSDVEMPMRNDEKTMCQTSTRSISTRVASAAMMMAEAPSPKRMRRRGSIRSARAPATRLKMIAGMAWAAATRPRATSSPVMS